MGDERKDEGVEYPIKMLLEDALEKQRNMMMDNFDHILQRLPTGVGSTYSSHLHIAATLEAQPLLRYK